MLSFYISNHSVTSFLRKFLTMLFLAFLSEGSSLSFVPWYHYTSRTLSLADISIDDTMCGFFHRGTYQLLCSRSIGHRPEILPDEQLKEQQLLEALRSGGSAHVQSGCLVLMGLNQVTGRARNLHIYFIFFPSCTYPSLLLL